MSIDDLYNNFKIVKQKAKKSVGASSGAQNLAFMTALSTSSTNDANTASPQVSTASPNVNATSPQVSTASFSDNDVYAFMVENPNGSNLLHQDLEQIHKDDLEVMDLRWKLSLLSMRAKSVSSILVGIIPIYIHLQSYLRTAISNFGLSLGRSSGSGWIIGLIPNLKLLMTSDSS
ncbi:hypothetical protein Tco_0132509 [Tanacetum coccineum]